MRMFYRATVEVVGPRGRHTDVVSVEATNDVSARNLIVDMYRRAIAVHIVEFEKVS